jgi:hypothetical protein
MFWMVNGCRNGILIPETSNPPIRSVAIYLRQATGKARHVQLARRFGDSRLILVCVQDLYDNDVVKRDTFKYKACIHPPTSLILLVFLSFQCGILPSHF